jgi:hypothetical protein
MFFIFKSIVQWKLSWVKSGVNRWLVLQFWGVGYFFFFIKEHHLGFCKNGFPSLEPKLLVRWEKLVKSYN